MSKTLLYSAPALITFAVFGTEIDIKIILYSLITLCVLGGISAITISLVAKKFSVYEDPRINDVADLLPGANCAGCGYPGCRGFAEALVKSSDISEMICPPGGANVMTAIANILGMTASKVEPIVAVVRCNGKKEYRTVTNEYHGAKTCAIQHQLYVGESECSYGCMGYGDCATSCKFDTIYIDKITGLPVINEEKCSGCGNCVKACPRKIIEIRNKGPKLRKIYVGCNNCDKGAIVRKFCKSACIACGKCQKVCIFSAITMENNLAYIDFKKCTLCRKCVSECPTNAINEVNFPVKKKPENIEQTEHQKQAENKEQPETVNNNQ